MPRTPKTPEQKFEERLDAILLCFGMTSVGIVSVAFASVLMLMPGVAEEWVITVFTAALSVVEVFGLLALGLFLSAPTTLRRLLKGRNDE
jgi:uncharacterized protein YqhQ